MEEGRRAVQRVINGLQPRQPTRRGLLGDSNGTVAVANRPGWAYIRYRDEQLSIVRYLLPVQYPDGTPVIVGKRYPGDAYEQVLNVDWEMYTQTPADSAVRQHATPATDLDDLSPGKVMPTDPVSLSVDARAFLYVNDDTAVEFAGDSIDLTANVPGGAGHRYVLVYMDLDTDTLAAEDGTLVALGMTAPAVPVPANGLPLGIVDLENGQATITGDDIYQYKAMYNVVGAQGTQGTQGPQGAQGAQGPQGAQGASGAQGSQGASGSQGAQGASGAQGSQGSSGSQGSQGAQGAQGAGGSGSQGAQGATGAQGPQGASGGPQGSQGATGAQGPQGAQGAQGAQGGGGDSNAIHDNVAAEISGIAEKTTPVTADLVVIEDSADSYNKKKVQLTNLGLGVGKVSELWANDGDPQAVDVDADGLINVMQHVDMDDLTDVHPDDEYYSSDPFGIFSRVSNRFRGGYHYHFRDGNVAPTNYSWVSDATFSGAPSIWTFMWYYSYAGGWTSDSPPTHFLARSDSVDYGGFLVARMRASHDTEIGLRVDDGSDDNYSEIILDPDGAGGYHVDFHYRQGGGAVLDQEGPYYPASEYVVVILDIADESSGFNRGLIVGEEGQYIFPGGFEEAITWTPDRVGIKVQTAGGGSITDLVWVDWFYEEPSGGGG